MRLMQPFHTLTNQIFDYVNLPHGLTHTTDLNQTDNKLDALITPSGGWGALIAVQGNMRKQQALTRAPITLLDLNQPFGTKCPSCAFPNGKKKPINFCENGAKATAFETTKKTVTVDFFAKYTVTELLAQSDYFLENQGRLTEPMQYNAATDKYEPIEWEAAYQLIASHLNRLDDPNEAVFYTSGRASNEASFLYQLFTKCYGTNNMPDCSNMCHEASSVGLKDSIGLGKATIVMDDFEHCDSVWSFGHNPGTNHPRMLETLANVAERGGKIIVINPLKERGLTRFQDPKRPSQMLTNGSTPLSHYFFQLNIGSDYALMTGILKYLDNWDREARDNGKAAIFDHDFIQAQTVGFDEMIAGVRATDWQTIYHITGLDAQQIEQLAQLYRESKRPILTWCMGITQHRHGTDNVHMLANLALIMGHIGKTGTGLAPIRGHSNVQGNRTMGVWDKPSDKLLDQIDKVFGIKSPRAHGYNVVETLEAMQQGKVKVFMSLAGNFAVATPDKARTEAGIRGCELTVQIQTKLNRSHLIHGKEAIILPCLGRTEIDKQGDNNQYISIEDSMCNVVLSQGARQPVSHKLRAETEIIASIAAATLRHSPIRWAWYVEDYDRIRNDIAKAIEGFDNFNQKVYTKQGFHLPHPANRYEWQTQSGKATFFFTPLTEIYADKLTAQPDDLLTLTSIRSHDQFNTTIYGLDDRYRNVFDTRQVIFMNADDADRLDLKAGDKVTIQSEYGDGIERKITGFQVILYEIPKGNLAMYYPEANPLIAMTDFDKKSGMPAFKTVSVRLKKCA